MTKNYEKPTKNMITETTHTYAWT